MSSAVGLHNFSLTYLSLHESASKENNSSRLPKSLVYAAYILCSILALMTCGCVSFGTTENCRLSPLSEKNFYFSQVPFPM